MVSSVRALLVSLVLFAPVPAVCQDAVVGRDAMQARLNAAPGYAGVFGVVRDDQIALGAAGQTLDQRPHETSEQIRWASVSKMITAILVFQQVDDGTLDLDAPVTRYVTLPTLPNADRITLRQLLAHRSGLAGQADTPDGPPGDLMQYCQVAAAEPGSVFLYNNCDTIVLGKVLEAMTGASFIDLANARIGSVVGATLSVPSTPRTEASLEDGSVEQPMWPSAYGPAGGLYGRIEDLLKIDAALMDGRLISASALQTMLTGDPASGYAALSVWSYSPDLGSCIGKTRLVERYGEIGGVQMRNFLLPDLRVALSVYSNDHRTVFGEVWQGHGLSVDLIRAAVCGPAAPE